MAGFAFVGKAVLFSFINLIYTLRAQRRLCARGRSVRRGGPFWRAGRIALIASLIASSFAVAILISCGGIKILHRDAAVKFFGSRV